MELRILIAPLYGAVLGGLCVGAFALARREALSRLSPRILFWGLVLAMLASVVGSRLGFGPAQWISNATALRAVGLVLVIGAAAIAWQAGKARQLAEALISTPGVPIDEAVGALGRGNGAQVGIFLGRLDAATPAMSPGGAPCAAFVSELRSPREGGLLDRRTGNADCTYLQGYRARVRVLLDAARVLAQTELRRTSDGSLAVEQVIPLQRPARIFGRLVPLSSGGYTLRAVAGAPLLISGPGVDLLDVGRDVSRRAWWLYGISAVLCCTAAFLLAQGS